MIRVLRVLLVLLFLSPALHADQVVAEVQRKLAKQGFYNGTVDGQMGSQTAAAIRRYQIAEHLTVNGQLTNETLKSLRIIPSPAPKATPKPRSQPAPQGRTPVQYEPVPEYVAIAQIFKGGPYIEAGPERQIAAISQAQKTLRLLGYYRGPVNGSPSPALVSALKAWQQSAGFRQTGRFDENTLKGLDIIRY